MNSTYEELLQELNREEAAKHLGAVVFISILMVIGVFGNMLVLYVFTFKMKPSNYRLFVLALATVDGLTCTTVIPFVLYNVTHPLLFTMVALCKLLRFNMYILCIGSVNVLVVIAVERYRKICFPHGRNLKRLEAKFAIAGALLLSTSFSWPGIILYGHNTVQTRVPGITGVNCDPDDKYRDTNLVGLYYVVLLSYAAVVIIILTVLYSNIIRTIIKRRNQQKATKTFILAANIAKPVIPDVSSTNSTDLDSGPTKRNEGNVQARRNKSGDRVVLTLFTITVVFFISFFPHLTLVTVANLDKDFLSRLSYTELFLQNTFVWCFFINYMANPIIYGFCDLRFRQHVKDLKRDIFNKLCCK